VIRRRAAPLAAAAVGVAAFVLYLATLLPDMDLGDTPSFQTRIGTLLLTPRDAYPLYTAIGTVFHWIVKGTPAHALNLASAVEGALACAVIVLVGVELSGSVAAAAAAALLFASSYTFWSQSIIAEVYALHLIFVALTLLLALRWARQPTLRRLAVLLATYALGFGNHLSMILLAPGLVIYLFAAAPGGWRSMLAPRVLAVAAVCAGTGALQYAWNLHTLWLLPDPPHGMVDALQRFWFDVTKADWRETMVLEVPRAMAADHAAMYAFDLNQQFGPAGPLFAIVGLARLIRTSWRQAVLVVIVYLANVLFALGYNVGDTHVFYLPSHLMIALLAAPALVLLGGVLRQRHVAVALLVAYVAARTWRDFPALDRSDDDRPAKVLAALTAGLDDRHAILLTDLNWQIQNGLSYFGKEIAPHLAYERMPAVILYAPALVADNASISREVALTERARAELTDAYGPLIESVRDPRVADPTLLDATRNLPERSRYVFCILKPTRDLSLDWDDIGRALGAQTGGRPIEVPDGDYIAIAGTRGRAPDLVVGSNRPFRRSLELDGVRVDIRMESWLAADTIRRMGFGHVIAAHHHTLIVERGVSFAAFDSSGRAIRTAYASNIFAPQARYLIR
jgi:transmembrane protein TMEM260 (protein O-mannosyltransferase)